MNKALIWILTKTAAGRGIAIFLTSLLIAWGIVSKEQEELVAGVVLQIVVGLASLWIEKRKTDETKLTQMQEGAKPDGLAGPKTRERIRQNRHGGRPV